MTQKPFEVSIAILLRDSPRLEFTEDRGESHGFSRGMNPTRSCYSLSYGGPPEFPRWDTPASPVQRLRVYVLRGYKSDTSSRRTAPGGANRGTVLAEYPAAKGRAVFVPSKRRPRVGRKAALTRLYAL